MIIIKIKITKEQIKQNQKLSRKGEKRIYFQNASLQVRAELLSLVSCRSEVKV